MSKRTGEAEGGDLPMGTRGGSLIFLKNLSLGASGISEPSISKSPPPYCALLGKPAVDEDEEPGSPGCCCSAARSALGIPDILAGIPGEMRVGSACVDPALKCVSCVLMCGLWIDEEPVVVMELCGDDCCLRRCEV